MDIIKEFCRSANTCVMRTFSYNHTVPYFNALIAEVKKDYPELMDENIEIVHYGGAHYAGTYGLEFRISGEPIDSYREISRLETTK